MLLLQNNSDTGTDVVTAACSVDCLVSSAGPILGCHIPDRSVAFLFE